MRQIPDEAPEVCPPQPLATTTMSLPPLPSLKRAKICDRSGTALATLEYPDDPLTKFVIDEILSGRAYHCPPAIRSGRMVIVDVGANLGATAIYFSCHYPHADIYCYEPCPATYALLERNTGPFSKIRRFNNALSSQDEFLSLFSGAASSVTNSVVKNADTRTDSTQVEALDARKVFEHSATTRISILKVDTEGCEIPILTRLRDHLPMIDTILVEYHSEEDRCAIDDLLSSSFKLYFSAATSLHRGTCGYLSRELIEMTPRLNQREIRGRHSQ